MSDKQPKGSGADSPATSTSVIPAKYIPYVLALISVLVYLGAEVALPGPWKLDRYLVVASTILSILAGGSVVLRRQ